MNGGNSFSFLFIYRDLCCFHLHKEEEAMIQLKMYGMNVIEPKLDSPQKNTEKDYLPSNLEDIDSYLSKATSNKPSRIEMEDPVVLGLAQTSHVLRKDGEPYNQVNACEIDEVAPKPGEVGSEVNRVKNSLCCWLVIIDKYVLIVMVVMSLLCYHVYVNVIYMMNRILKEEL